MKFCRIASSQIRARNAGFTIIEVLFAIAVVAISLTAIGALTGVTTRGVRSLEQHVALVEAARTLAASLPPPPRVMNVLLAEDNVVNQRVAIGLLAQRGHKVTVVSNGREACAARFGGGRVGEMPCQR